jgi:alanine dehydrogenase
MMSTSHNLNRVCSYADVIVGAVHVPGLRAPIVITREMVRLMRPRAIIMDISIDQGGCVETSRPTNHEHPIYMEEGMLHYCVPNMPGAVARTATHAFVNAAMPYILEIANSGPAEAIRQNSAIEQAVNTHEGQLVHLTLLSGGGHDGLE